MTSRKSFGPLIGSIRDLARRASQSRLTESCSARALTLPAPRHGSRLLQVLARDRHGSGRRGPELGRVAARCTVGGQDQGLLVSRICCCNWTAVGVRAGAHQRINLARFLRPGTTGAATTARRHAGGLGLGQQHVTRGDVVIDWPSGEALHLGVLRAHRRHLAGGELEDLLSPASCMKAHGRRGRHRRRRVGARGLVVLLDVSAAEQRACESRQVTIENRSDIRAGQNVQSNRIACPPEGMK